MFIESDLFEHLPAGVSFDFIASNPPYVSESEYEQLARDVRDFEPPVALFGGPDGLAPAVLARSSFTLALSRLTLPHALARVVLTEQLYRAHCILANHPYHRE